MRKSIYILIMVILAVSCSEMNDVHQKYIESNQVIYLKKPVFSEVLTGVNRAKFVIPPSIDARVEEYVFKYNNNNDSIIVELGQDTIELVIDTLKETVHTFNLISRGSGLKSLVKEQLIKVYGEIYQGEIYGANRKIVASSINSSSNKASITWGEDPGCSGVEFNYTNLNMKDTSVVFNMPFDESNIGNINLDSAVYYRTVYNPGGLDSFYTKSVNIN